MIRRIGVVALLVVSGLLLLAGGTLLYVQREFGDSGRFADRLTSALRDRDVRAVLARRVTAAIEEGRPDLIAARPVIRSAVARAAASAPFEAAVRSAAVALHESVFDRDRATATLAVPDAGVLVVDALRRRSPAVARRIAGSIETRTVSLVTLHESATSVANRADELAAAAVPALVLGVLAMLAALFLVRDGRGRLVAAGATVAAAGAAGLLALAIARGEVLDRLTGSGQEHSAGGAVWDACLGGLRGWYLAAVVCGLVVTAAAALVPAGGRARMPRGRPVAVALALLAVLVAGVLVARSVTTPEGPRFASERCNGHKELCSRRLDQVALAATHNSMAAASDPGWFFAQQERGIAPQLEDGIRGLLIDSHYGVRTPRGIATDLSAEGKTRAQLVAEVGEPFVRAAERLRGRIGFTGAAKPELFLCHGACEVGATPMVPALESIRDFAVRHPDQVIVLSIQDDISPADTVDAFKRSGLLPLVYKGPSGPPWPTLGSLVESGHRIVVFGENDTGDVPWYRPQFKLVQDTPFGIRSPAELDAPSSCDPNRGPRDASLFLLNHWVDTPPANKPSNAAIVNRYDALRARARRCEKQRDRLPNLLAVDFYKTGDVVRVSDTLNGFGGH